MPTDSKSVVRTLFKGGTVLFLGLFLELGISFLAKLVIARVLGPVDYGVVSLGITTTTIASTLVLLGLDVGVGRYLPRSKTAEERRGVLVSAFQLAVPLSIVVGIGVSLAAPVIATDLFHDPSTEPVLRVFGLAIPLAALMKLTIGGVQGLQRSLPKVLIRNIVNPVARFAGILLVLALGFRGVGIAWAYVLSYAVAGAVGVYFLATRTPLFERGVRAVSMHRELLAFSAPLVVSTTMTLVLSDIDTFMLGALSTSGAVGIYNTVYPIAELLTVMLASFSFIFMPVVSELHGEGQYEETRRLYQVVAKWIFVLSLPLFALLSLYPRRAILLTFGPEYVAGALALSVLTIAFFTHAIAGPNSSALTSVGRTRLIMLDNTFIAALNVGLNLVLIPRYSYLGAAAATAVSYVLLNLLYSYQLYREMGAHPFSPTLVRSGAVSVALVAGHYALVSALDPTLSQFVALYAGFLLAYLLVVLRFGVEQEEVMLVLSFEERFGVDLGPLKRLARRFVA
ncbi:flippase [Halomarina halobia]|uniref:Flippase n=1 Tax=Halomarina halobia TaxID=3033386 RepID=A0ABD6A9X6_9EURY|nr:flippase [Halomarina sp. PSR21]